MVSRVKFNSFLVTNEHPERICLYLVREFDYEPSKIGHFQISKSIFGANCDLIFLKQKFLFEYQIRRTTFIKSMYFFDQSEKLYLVKMSPIFDGSSSNCLTRYKQILSGCSFVTIKLLNFTRLTMKCHDRGHATVYHICFCDSRCDLKNRQKSAYS